MLYFDCMTALTLMLGLMQATTGRITLALVQTCLTPKAVKDGLTTHHIGMQLCSSSATSMGVPKNTPAPSYISKMGEADTVSNFSTNPSDSGWLEMFLGVRKRPF